MKNKPRIDLNPSSADRWTTCTASPKFIFDNWDKLPEQDRTFADEGTTAHEVAAALLQGRKVDTEACPVPPTPEMHQHAWDYAEFVESKKEEGGKILVEQKLPLFYVEKRNAIVDAAVINPNGLHIVDYKYGEGIIVSPENNLQAIIYARCASRVFPVAPWRIPSSFVVSLTIYQPRTRGNEPFHNWETTWGEIIRAAMEIKRVATEILEEGKLVFAPSEKACQWCPAKGFCEARQATLAKLVPTGQLATAPGVLSMEQIVAVLQKGDDLIKWVKDVKAYALQFMRNGGKIPGHKLVLSRGGNRYWSDEKLAGKYLLADSMLTREEVYEESIIGPAAVEKLLGKGQFPKRVYNLISKPPGQPVIAPEDDPRDDCRIDAAQEFQKLD